MIHLVSETGVAYVTGSMACVCVCVARTRFSMVGHSVGEAVLTFRSVIFHSHCYYFPFDYVDCCFLCQ